MDASQLVDITMMAKIIEYLEHDPHIEDMVEIVNGDIGEVGNIMMANDRTKEFMALVDAGDIRVGYRGNIPPKNAVQCIRLLPFYIVKDIGKVYQ